MLRTNLCMKSIWLLKKCGNMKQLEQIHAKIIVEGLALNGYAVSRLMNFCSDPVRGNLLHARKIFDQFQPPTLCIYNTMMKSYLLKGEFDKTIQIYRCLMREGLCPDNYTIPYLLKACGYVVNHQLCEEIHASVEKLGLVFDVLIGNSLVWVYSSCGEIDNARKLFDEMPERTEVLWTVMISGYSKRGDIDTARFYFDEAPTKDVRIWGAMISGYVQNNCAKEGLLLFRMMQATGLQPDESILVSVIGACAQLGALNLGTWVHRYLKQLGVSCSIKLGTALIDMYAKCGNVSMAQKAFDEMTQRDSVSWTAMIMGLALNGDGKNAMKLFHNMKRDGFTPNDITFIAVFTACSYCGMVEDGLRLFHEMDEVYGIKPKCEHYSCVVDFLCRAGLFEEAKNLLLKMPRSGSPSEEAIPWRAFLSSCSKNGEIQMAEFAAKELWKLESHSGAYVLLSNVYASSGMHDDARRIMKMMKKNGVEKVPGCSSIELNGSVHEFVVSANMDTQKKDVYKVLETISAHMEIGYPSLQS